MKSEYLTITMTRVQSQRARKAISWYRDYGGSGVRIPAYAAQGIWEVYHALLTAEQREQWGAE